MGKKRKRKRQRIFFHCACLLITLLSIAGCGATLSSQRKSQGHRHIDQAEKLISDGDYAGAMKEYEAAVSLSPDEPPGDSALFHMGLIWAHPDNPDKNYGKALEYFQRIVADIPGSALIEEARTWISAINELLLSNIRTKGLEETINSMQNELVSLKETGEKLEGKNKELEETAKAMKKQLSALKETGMAMEEKNKDLEETVKALKNQLNALKEIDLGIDEERGSVR